jgi:hypothetical protein
MGCVAAHVVAAVADSVFAVNTVVFGLLHFMGMTSKYVRADRGHGGPFAQ